MIYTSYSQAVADARGHLTLTLDLSEPIEVEEFARLFAGLGGMFDDYLREEQSTAKGQVRLYIKEVRKGSIVADIVPSIPDLIDMMDKGLIVLGFASLFSRRVRCVLTGQFLEGATKSDVAHTMDVVQAIAQDPNATAILETIVIEEDGESRRVEIAFTSSEARQAVKTLENQKAELDKTTEVDHTRVLMTFVRPSIQDSRVGKSTGERAIIPEINDKDRPVLYSSDLASSQIKDLLRSSDENVFRKGFDVDVNVEMREGKPVAYRIVALHDVVDLE